MGPFTLAIISAISSAIFSFCCMWMSRWVLNVLSNLSILRDLIWTLITHPSEEENRSKNCKFKWTSRVNSKFVVLSKTLSDAHNSSIMSYLRMWFGYDSVHTAIRWTYLKTFLILHRNLPHVNIKCGKISSLNYKFRQMNLARQEAKNNKRVLLCYEPIETDSDGIYLCICLIKLLNVLQT
jgi:hypothetical protein